MEIYRSSATLKEINPALKEYYEYDTLEPYSLTYRDYDRALKTLASLIQGRDLLEVGCGTGSFLKFAQSRGWRATGVDSSPENIRELEKKGIRGIATGFLDYSPSESFDVVVLWDLIEHPQDPFCFVEKARELLKRGGLLLIATPHDPNLLSNLATMAYRLSGGRIKFAARQLYVIEHTSYFSIKTLSMLLERANFKVVKAWKTETDLKRYYFSCFLRVVLYAAFFIAGRFGLQNRMIVIAKKSN